MFGTGLKLSRNLNNKLTNNECKRISNLYKNNNGHK